MFESVAASQKYTDLFHHCYFFKLLFKKQIIVDLTQLNFLFNFCLQLINIKTVVGISNIIISWITQCFVIAYVTVCSEPPVPAMLVIYRSESRINSPIRSS